MVSEMPLIHESNLMILERLKILEVFKMLSKMLGLVVVLRLDGQLNRFQVTLHKKSLQWFHPTPQ